jgi:carbon starvation protein
MNAIFVLILAILGIVLGYGWYAKSIDKKIIQPDDSKTTPATMYMDGVDFTPANRNVLFGYQFKSVAALGPIVGPIVAVRWGWLPALLWVILGTFFIGWVQDYASIVLGVREEGQSFGALSYRLVSPRARTILLIFIYTYLLLIMGAFGKIVGYDLLTSGAVPFGVLIAIGAGLLAGQMTYKMKQDIILTTVVTVVIAFIGIFLAKQDFIGDIFAAINGTKDGAAPAIVFGTVTWPQFLWSLVTLVLCGIGAILPIWRWAQPINYVAFWIVFLGIVGGTLGVIVWHPSISSADFPAFTTWNGTLKTETAGALPAFGPLWPLMFVTIACGAISGWHSLVSSSGTARQLEKEGDALFVGGGSMFLEMFVATLALLTAVVGVGADMYITKVGAGANAGVFANGLATFLNKIKIPVDYGLPYAMVFLTLMALTIMYLVVRFMRVASAEFLGDRVPALKNTTVGTVVALVFSAVLMWTGFWEHVWILFGGANQLMAALALLLISLWLMSKGKNYMWAFIPFVFMFITTIAALIRTAYVVIDKALNQEGLSATEVFGSWLSGAIAVVLIVAALVLAWDSIQAIQKYRAEAPVEAD